MKRNGNLLYTILPIQGAIDVYYRQQFQKADEEQQKHRTAALMEKLNLSPAEEPA